MALAFFNILPIYELDGQHFLVALVDLVYLGREDKRTQRIIVLSVLRSASVMSFVIVLYSMIQLFK